MLKLVFTVLGVLLLPVAVVLSQSNINYSFHHLNKSTGFPAEFVRSMEFDSTGQLWAITDRGLMCYNGHSGQFYQAQLAGVGSAFSQPMYLYIDRQQILWITYADAALSFFDPITETFTHFRHDPDDLTSFPNGIASSFLEDSRGNFWIGTWGGALCKLDRSTGKFERFLPDTTNEFGLSSSNITNLKELSDGTLVLSTWEGDGYDNALTLYDPDQNQFRKFDLSLYAFENAIEAEKIPRAFRIVHFVEEDEAKNWWVGTYTGLFYVDHTQKTVARITGLNKDLLNSKGLINFDNVMGMQVENADVIWFNTFSDGILVYDKKMKDVGYIRRDHYNQSSISGNVIRDIASDPYGNIWVATKSGGLDIYMPNEAQVKILSNEFLQAEKLNPSLDMFAINHMVVSTTSPEIAVCHGNGFSIYNTETGEVQRIEIRKPFLEALARNPALQKHNHNNPNFVGVLFEVTDGYILGTYCGAVRYYKSSGRLDFSALDRFSQFRPEAYTGKREMFLLTTKRTLSDEGKEQSVTTINSLNLITEAEEEYVYMPMDIGTGEQPSYLLFEALDSSSYFMPFSKNSFITYNVPKNELKTYSYLKPHNNFPDTNLVLLHIDNFGISWIKSANGLYAFDYKTGEAINIKPEIDLKPEDDIRCLMRDQNGILWIALAADLIRYNLNTKESFRFNKDHGFDVGGFSERFVQKHNRSEVIIPSHDGLLMFDPGRVVFHTRPPRMFISNIIIDKDTLSAQDELNFISSKQSLAWDQNFITIEFATDLLYASGGKTYQYRLIGLDSSWVSTTFQNKVVYTNLQSGDYEFQVRCIDGYNNMSNTLSLPFFIDKPFWLKWWFISLEVVVSLLLIILYTRWRERSLRRSKIKLEMAVDIRTKQVQEKVSEIEHQKEIIEDKNKELTDSINYAKGIQDSLLAHRQLLDDNLPEYTIFFRPKDIVSGDFYWAAKTRESFFVAICDSTGHGVPGAFMSLLNIRYLYEAIVEKNITSPNIALDYVRMRLSDNLSLDASKDGMDGTLFKYDEDTRIITYCSAETHPLLIRRGVATLLPADKMPIGGGFNSEPFQPRHVQLESGDVVYFFTDGYPDQFGGPKGAKLKHTNLINFLLTIWHMPLEDQLIRIEDHFDEWKGNLEQLDDVLLFAIRIPE